jgi:hypothetical protein
VGNLIEDNGKMGIKTGRPRGRPKGAKNKRTIEREAEMRKMAIRIASVVGGAFEGDALAYLTWIYKDPAKPESVRLDAARAALRYERPALAPLQPVERGPTRLLEQKTGDAQEESPWADLSCLESGPTSSAVEPNLDPSEIVGAVEMKFRYRELCDGCDCDPGNLEELNCPWRA